MRLHLAPEPLLFLITSFLLAPNPIAASPNPAQSTLAGFAYNELFARWDCPSPSIRCGWASQLCCPYACYTNAKTQAECTPAASSWGWRSSQAPAVSAAASGGVNSRSRQVKTTGKASPGLRGTSHSSAVVTETDRQTIPYQTPVASGAANVTMLHSSSSSGLSGGAIAGIVIGVLVALLILGIICFYCCLKGIWDGCLALFGVGRKRKVTEVDEYTRRTHHSSGGSKKRTWYGSKPTKKVEKRDSHGKEVLGVLGGLAGLWAILGLKRRREDRRRHDEKYSEYSYSSYYDTSSSSASSDDRRSERYSRHSVRRSGSRRP